MLALTFYMLVGCGGAAPIETSRPVKPATHLALAKAAANAGVALKSVEVIDFDREAFREVSQFDPYQGLARLSDGRCVELRRKRRDGDQTVAVILEGAAACESLAKLPSGLAGLPCSGAAESSQVGNWRLKCVPLADGRSALVAVGASPSNLGRNVTLAVLDHGIHLFKVFIIHPGSADVTTLGWRNDGKAAITSFVWLTSSTNAEYGRPPSKTAKWAFRP